MDRYKVPIITKRNDNNTKEGIFLLISSNKEAAEEKAKVNFEKLVEKRDDVKSMEIDKEKGIEKVEDTIETLDEWFNKDEK